MVFGDLSDFADFSSNKSVVIFSMSDIGIFRWQYAMNNSTHILYVLIDKCPIFKGNYFVLKDIHSITFYNNFFFLI